MSLYKDDEEVCTDYRVGQRVLMAVRGGGTEIATVVKSETGSYPFDVWVFSPTKGYASCYAFSSVKPLPNGQL
jgi:hypothetical protein